LDLERWKKDMAKPDHPATFARNQELGTALAIPAVIAKTRAKGPSSGEQGSDSNEFLTRFRPSFWVHYLLR
jgi:hypothetical protein